MRGGIILTVMLSVAALLANVPMAQAQTCADQHQACLKRGHTVNECTASIERCLKTGRWVGPAGNEYPISKKK
jgi:hypothetical protein